MDILSQGSELDIQASSAPLEEETEAQPRELACPSVLSRAHLPQELLGGKALIWEVPGTVPTACIVPLPPPDPPGMSLPPESPH